MKLDIIGIVETRWTDNGCVKRDDYTFIYSGGIAGSWGGVCTIVTFFISMTALSGGLRNNR